MDPRALLQRLMDAAKLNPNSLAERTGKKTKQPQIYRFLEGTTLEPKRSTLEPVARVFGVSVEAFFNPQEADKVWAERFSGEPSRTTRSPEGAPPFGGTQSGVTLTQELSRLRPTMDPQTIEWGDTLHAKLPSRFILALPDDALAPDFPAGTRISWSTEKPPRVGSVVLVRDQHGQAHAREYRQGRAPGQWIAAPTGRAFASLDGAEITLLAVAEFEYRPLP